MNSDDSIGIIELGSININVLFLILKTIMIRKYCQLL